MPLQLNFTTPSTGAVASYHVVQQVGLDYVSSLTNATVASYLDSSAKGAGKFPMYTQQIQIDGLPDAGADARSFAESSLIVAALADGSASVGTNRYVFAGAELVD
ncbi:hypothetical protein ACFSHT_10470 [Paraburkholderia silviterrae]|uniref:Uncharacterized protein n=1 Tax=Paraburkholderia silviterrae TaxID=2528715 RepID=A0A4R5MEP1_9BURK|nr:hypothetical protein [Paraburkholderia silviterrae]TDG25374.1 hypothetical protein EYW47_05950 [Paraburkholderia silviterrae]